MSRITSGVGVFSGIDRGAIIDQLLALDGRAKTVYQKRGRDITQQQAALLDVNTRMSALRSAASKFSVSRVFASAAASSSDDTKMTAAATPGAASGSYRFSVDRLVSTQQSLSRGFADSTSSAVGITSLRLESARGQASSDTLLSQLNGGIGVARGKIVLTDSSGAAATVDLSKVGTVGEALAAINNATGVRVTASVDGDRLVLADSAGGLGNLRVENAAGYTTATSLGIAGTAGSVGSAGRINGTAINTVGGATALTSLNDGRGVGLSRGSTVSSPDFTITTRSGVSYAVDIGDVYEMRAPTVGAAPVLTKTKSAVSDLQGVIDRINDQAKTGAVQAVRASLNADRTGIELEDLTTPAVGVPSLSVAESGSGTTAADLGIQTTTTGATITGRRLTAGLNSVMLRSVNGGQGISGTALALDTKDGQSFSLTIDQNKSLSDLLKQISSETGGAVTASLNERGTGITLTDTTSGPGSFLASGTAATSLKLTAGGGKWGTDNLQIGYLGRNSRLTTLPGNRSVTAGSFEIISSYGTKSTVNIPSDAKTLGDVISAINSNAPDVQASMNDTGDGLVIREKVRAGLVGGQKISIRDLSGTAARDLNLVGTATATGLANVIDGTFDKTVTFDSGDTLQQVADKINLAGGLASATIVNDGSSSRAFRLVLTSRASGSTGAFKADSGLFDLGISQTAEAQDSRIFYGSEDPARALLLQSTTNTVTGIAANLTVTAKAVSTTPVTVTVNQDPAAILTSITDFVTAFNNLVGRIDELAKYDTDANKRGVLLGNSMVQEIRSSVFSIVQGTPFGVTGRYRTLAQAGLTIDSTNTMQFNSNKLTTALADDPQAVADMFSARGATQTSVGQTPVLDRNGVVIPGAFVGGSTTTTTVTRQGILERLADSINRYTRPTDGLFVVNGKNMDQQLKSQTDKIAAIDVRLATKRATLDKQFIAMESTIGRLQQQQGSLSSIRAF